MTYRFKADYRLYVLVHLALAAANRKIKENIA
jgi:hypothetical protein